MVQLERNPRRYEGPSVRLRVVQCPGCRIGDKSKHLLVVLVGGVELLKLHLRERHQPRIQGEEVKLVSYG